MYLAHGMKPYKDDGKFRKFLVPLILFSMAVGHYAPPHLVLLMMYQIGLQQVNETFRLLVTTCWASENVI